jgi:hypothetical protein
MIKTLVLAATAAFVLALAAPPSYAQQGSGLNKAQCQMRFESCKANRTARGLTTFPFCSRKMSRCTETGTWQAN